MKLVHYIRKWLKDIPHRLASIPESPHQIARAFALGVFIGMLPGPGGILAVTAAMALRLSKVAALLGAMITNPWTAPFFYVMSYKVGVWVIRIEEPVLWKSVLTFQANWHSELFRAALPLLIGSIILGTLMSMVCYGLVYWVVDQYRKVRLHQRHHP